MKRNLRLICVGLVLCMLMMAGCARQNDGAGQSRAQTTDAYAVIEDDMGRTVTLAQKPQRVVVLSTSLLHFADAVGGDLAGRSTAVAEDIELPKRYESVPDVGPVYNVSAEKIIGLQPDLVVASEVQHKKLVPLLEQNGIPVIALRSKTYEDVKRNLEIFGQIYGKADVAKAKEKEMDEAIQAIVQKIPPDHKKAAIIHATPSSVTVQLDGSIAGSVARMLHLDNIAAGTQSDGHKEKIPYSMEALVQSDPDIIFFTSMGPADKIEERIRQDVASNPSWTALRAVQQGRVYVLPERYFLLNPGLAYPDAVAYMAKLAYPEAFP